MEILPSSGWLETKFEHVDKAYDVWHRFGRLAPQERNAIMSFLRLRNRDADIHWSLFFIGAPPKSLRRKLFGHVPHEQVLPLILCKRNGSKEAFSNESSESKSKPEGPPATSSSALSHTLVSDSSALTRPERQSVYDDQVSKIPKGPRSFVHLRQPQVSFVDHPGKAANSDSELKAPHRQSGPKTREAIRRTETKKKIFVEIDQGRRDDSDETIEIIPREQTTDRDKRMMGTHSENRVRKRNSSPNDDWRNWAQVTVPEPVKYREREREPRSGSDGSPHAFRPDGIIGADSGRREQRHRSRAPGSARKFDDRDSETFIRQEEEAARSNLLLVRREASEERRRERRRSPTQVIISNQPVIPDRTRRSRRHDSDDDVEQSTFSRRSTGNIDYESRDRVRDARDSQALVLYERGLGENGDFVGKHVQERRRGVWDEDDYHDGWAITLPDKSRRDRISSGRRRMQASSRHHHKDDASSEDDYDGFPPIYSDKAKSTRRGPEVSDEEVIARTLKRYTTFTGDELPAKTPGIIVVGSQSAQKPAGALETIPRPQEAPGHVEKMAQRREDRQVDVERGQRDEQEEDMAGFGSPPGIIRISKSPFAGTSRVVDAHAAAEEGKPHRRSVSSSSRRSYDRVDMSMPSGLVNKQAPHRPFPALGENQTNDNARKIEIDAEEKRSTLPLDEPFPPQDSTANNHNVRIIGATPPPFPLPNIEGEKKRVSPGALWTKIGRKLVNPEALTQGNERFEELADYVVIFRVMTKAEIEEYAALTREIRAERSTAVDKSFSLSSSWG